MLPHTTKRRTTTNLKTKQELPENQTIWKSDTQGVKEETFIQTDGRGRDRQLRWRGHVVRWRLVDWAVPHSHADKLGGTIGERDRQHNPGFQHGKLKPQTTGSKNLWGLLWQEKLQASQESLLERPTEA